MGIRPEGKAVQVYHNLSDDAWMNWEPEHPLIKVWEADHWVKPAWPSPRSVPQHIFQEFNIGTGEVAQSYRMRRLRSLSVGDVLILDDWAFSCQRNGTWARRYIDQLNIITAAEAERIVRERWGFDPGEPLSLTVPWVES